MLFDLWWWSYKLINPLYVVSIVSRKCRGKWVAELSVQARLSVIMFLPWGWDGTETGS